MHGATMQVLLNESDQVCLGLQSLNIFYMPVCLFLGRKRTRREDSWKRNDKKLKRNSGLEYTTDSGKTISAKMLKPPCGISCRLKCRENISEPQRQIILNKFNALSDLNRRRDFISKNMIKVEPKYRYVKEGSKRSENFSYFLKTEGNNTKVCKTFFKATLCINDTEIQTIKKKIGPEGMISPEHRGKYAVRTNMIDAETKANITRHINSFAKVESHYLRAQSSRHYIDGSLTLSEMYRLYVIDCQEKSLTHAKKHFYCSVFNTEFNIGFHQPKKDQCAKCETFKNSPEDVKEELLESYETHIFNKDLSRAEKSKDVQESLEENSSTLVCCYDLQAVLSTPCGEISSFYYMRKLSTFNFTIYDITEKEGHCFVWHEALAKRGCNEIASCVLEFLKLNRRQKNIIFYSDNCCGQNKNRYIFGLYLYAVMTMDIESITHKYLIVGHTQNEGDSMHSLIEKEKKRALKSGPIYVPSQWVPVIKLSKKNGKPFVMREMDTPDFLDFQKLTNEMGNNFSTDEDGESIAMKDIKIVMFEKKSPYILHVKTTYEQEHFQRVNIRNKMRGRPPLEMHQPSSAYREPPKISKEK